MEELGEVLLESIKHKLCKAEEDVMSALSFDFEVVLPTQFLHTLNQVLVDQSIEMEVFRFSKIFLLDIVRSGISLFYAPLDLMIASLFLAHYSLAGGLWAGNL